MKEYLLFDLDGTLTDSGPGITKSVQYALRSLGIEEPDLKKLEGFVGPPLRDSFQRFYAFDKEKTETAVAKYRERYAQVGIFENSLYDGIEKMLRKLKKNGFHLAVASSKPQEYVERVLEHFHIRQYFQVIVGGTMDGKGDDKKDIIGKVLKQFFKDRPAEKEKVYMIGDTAFDVIGASQAGVESIGVCYGFGKLEDFTGAKADYIVQSVWELEDFLMREVRAKETKAFLWRQAPEVLFWVALFLILREFVASLLMTWAGKVSADGDVTGNLRAVCSAAAFLLAGGAIFPAAKKWIREGRIDRRLQYLTAEPYLIHGILGLAGVMFVCGFHLLFEITGFTAVSESYRQARESWISVSPVVGILCFGVISPIVEELVFRGILYNYSRKLFRAFPAIVLNGILFGIYHGNPVQGIYAFLMGMFLSYGYEYFGEFRVCVILHMLFNLAAFGMGYLDPDRSLLPFVCVISLLVGCAELVLLHRRKNVL